MMRLRTLLLIVLASGNAAFATPRDTPSGQPSTTTESIDQALCRITEKSATTHHLEIEFFTRLIWRESNFRLGATSRAGAQGIAQFMPRTAVERGLADPFDPEQAIPKAAELLAELLGNFGNFGLAAAAYNAGPTRVRNWLSGSGGLPDETRAYVTFITGRSADEWAADTRGRADLSPSGPQGAPTCLQLTAVLRRPGLHGVGVGAETPFASWGVQLAGNFSKALALASYSRARQSYAAIIGEITPMIIGTRLRSRGTRAFYRVRVPAATRVAADNLCNRIRAAGGSCIVLHS